MENYKVKGFSLWPRNAEELERRANEEGANQSKLVNLALDLYLFPKQDRNTMPSTPDDSQLTEKAG